MSNESVSLKEADKLAFATWMTCQKPQELVIPIGDGLTARLSTEDRITPEQFEHIMTFLTSMKDAIVNEDSVDVLGDRSPAETLYEAGVLAGMAKAEKEIEDEAQIPV